MSDDSGKPAGPGLRRLVSTALVAALSLLAFEGAMSAAGEGSFLRSVPRLWSAEAAEAPDLRPLSDEERRRAAAENPGILRAHADPRVGYVLRASSDLALRDTTVRSDGLGLRVRAGPPPPQDALRIAVLGASIPFGYGLQDDEVLAHRLELALNEARGPDARFVLCRTVAMGRWNERNAAAFLHDHMADLRPDLVLAMPFSNDLSDTDAVDESGHRRAAPDPLSADPLTSVRSDSQSELFELMKTAGAQGLMKLDDGLIGATALDSDLSAESSRRLDEAAGALLDLHEELQARGSRLVYLQYLANDHAWHMLRRLQEKVPDLPVIPLLSDVPRVFTLGDDPHPNAHTIEVLASWVARELLDRGLLERGTGPLPPEAPDEYEALRAKPYTPGEIQTLSREARELTLAKLQPALDLLTGRGICQVYGGIGLTGYCGPRLLLLLARQGNELEVELAPMPERPDLYPLDVAVEADGEVLGAVHLVAGETASASFPLPASDSPTVEVRLRAPDWVVTCVGRLGTSEMAAFRPLRVSCENR